MMAARRLGNPCLCGIRIHIPHAESSRQAIIRDSLLRRRKVDLQVSRVDVKGKSPIRHFHSFPLQHGPAAATAMRRGNIEVDEDDDLDEGIGTSLDPDDWPFDPRMVGREAQPNEPLFNFIPDSSLSIGGSEKREVWERAANLTPKPRIDPSTPEISYPQTSIASVIRSRLRTELVKADHETLEAGPSSVTPSGSSSIKLSAPVAPPSLVKSVSTLSREHRVQRGQFISRIREDPVTAFLQLSSLDPSIADTLSPMIFDSLYVRLDAVHRSGVDLVRVINREDARRTLEWLSDPSAGPSILRITKHSTAKDQYPSETIAIRTSRGFRFKYFLQLSCWLRCTDFQRPLFNSLYLPHLQKGEYLDLPHLSTRNPWPTAKLIEDLSLQLKVYKAWDTLINLFADQRYPESSVHLPIRYWTPKLLSKVMLAYHHTGNPAAILPVWEEYIMAGRPLPTNAVVYHRVMTAHLKLGNMVEVRRYQRLSREAGFDTPVDTWWEAWNILQAQRQYGMDPRLEEQVLATLDAAPLLENTDDADDPATSVKASSPVHLLAADVVHGLIQLRLDSNDYDIALRLLHRFDLLYLPDVEESTTLQPIKPTRKTLVLAFEVYSQLKMDTIADYYWNLLTQDEAKTIRDAHVARYVRHMVRRNKGRIAFQMVKTAMLQKTTTKPDKSYALPPGRCEIGTRTINALLFGESEQHSIEGLVEVLGIMEARRIPMNGDSIRWILRCLSKPSSGDSEDPIDLAATLSFLVRQADIPESAAQQLDSVMSRAIDEYNKAQALRPDPLADLDFEHPGVSLRPMDSLRSAVKPVISDMTARWLTSESTSFAYRLEFEAMAGTQTGGMPSARYLWNQLIARGYKMSKRHLLGLVKGYTAAGRMDAAESVLELARQSNMPITRGMWFAMIRGYERQPDRARNCYEAIRDDPEQGMDQRALSHMVNIYSRSGHHDQALKLIERDLGDVKLDDVSIWTFGMAYFRAGDPASAVELLYRHRRDQRLEFRPVEMLTSCYTLLSNWAAEKRASPRDREACGMAEELLLKAQEEEQRKAALEEAGSLNPTRRLLDVLARSRIKGGIPADRGWKDRES